MRGVAWTNLVANTGSTGDDVPAHGSRRRHDATLPGAGDQRGGCGRAVERGERDDPYAPAGAPGAPRSLGC